MASISSLMGSSSSGSIYGSRNSNIISGLASGLDTESMIEGMLESYKQKITGLQQNRQSLLWQQEAYQSISDKLVEFSRKYMSYTSSTNLLSSSFFNNAVLTTTGGKFADMVSATGKTSSNVTIDAVAQLATSSRYTHSASGLGQATVGTDGKLTVTGDGTFDVNGKMNVSELEGSLSLKYGNKEITINFDELEFFDKKGDGSGTITADDLKSAIEKKLEDQKITLSSGDQKAASELIKVEVGSNGEITFSDKTSAGNTVEISGATGKLKDSLGLTGDKLGSSFTFKEGTYTTQVSTAEYLSDKSITVTLNGVKKTISLADIVKDGNGYINSNDTFKDNLQSALDKAFGGEKVTVGVDGGKLSFAVSQGSTLAVSSSVGKALGFEDSMTTYVNTSQTLGQLGSFNADTGTLTFGGGTPLQGVLMEKVPKDQWIKQDDGTYIDSQGNKLDAEGYRLSKDGERLYEFSLTVNGKEVGKFTQDTALETVMNAINSDTEAGVNVSYSNLTNQFVFTAKESGEGGQIEMGDGLAQALFGKVDIKDETTYTAGQDAIFKATVNGSTMYLSRSSNTFDMDGMSVTLKGTFNNTDRGTDADPIKSSDLTGMTSTNESKMFEKGESVTFTSKSDTDTIVDAIKQMVEDYNKIVTEVKGAYSDMPLQQTNGSRYEPLTEDQKADMSESEIEAYEEKAKTGLLFGDNDLSSLYNALRSAVTPGGSDGSLLRSIGIKTSYSEGLTTIELDESALREALETNPDQVKDIFTKSKDNGASSDGLMTSIQKVTNRYAATTGATKGILIEKAGSKYSPTAALDNTLLDQMNEIDDQIETWQNKMSDKVDYYTNKFTQLEMLIQQMNSQSSTLSGLMGGY
ncbi:flagellar filament capping protein FliD [Anaeromassilibacillus sp. An200]|uniref:flagellar filament capping protein FliD n=1 Tax=Anaeromassilibacillus sp. An200 TaxID=1965587 RepID=UPI000B3A8790|nr:flagellar filament capping protein FliD [Anaeromassilibacillus sp. An200]OUP10595.1 flagellar hook protein [Anaeromassilibacillus sp. An200]